MACREEALSEDYQELLLDYILPIETENILDSCVQMVDEQFYIVYIEGALLPPISVTDFTYNSIPKLYGLMQNTSADFRNFDPLSLIRTGITELQRPPLSLTGKNVVIGFIDTGDCVKLLSGYRTRSSKYRGFCRIGLNEPVMLFSPIFFCLDNRNNILYRTIRFLHKVKGKGMKTCLIWKSYRI